MAEEFNVTVYQTTDGWFMALCNDFPGITGEGRTRDECVADLTRNIEGAAASAAEPQAAAG